MNCRYVETSWLGASRAQPGTLKGIAMLDVLFARKKVCSSLVDIANLQLRGTCLFSRSLRSAFCACLASYLARFFACDLDSGKPFRPSGGAPSMSAPAPFSGCAAAL